MSTKSKAARKPRSPKKPRTMSGSAKPEENPENMEMPGEVPGDLKAFFGHPLVNGEDNQASALALLHEYQNLPAIDHTDNKLRDRYDSLSDILSKNEQSRSGGSDQYSLLMHSDVDAFLNISSSSNHPSAHLASSPANISPKSDESMHSSGGILDASGSPKDATDINTHSPDSYDLPDLAVNSPPPDSPEMDAQMVTSPQETVLDYSHLQFKRSPYKAMENGSVSDHDSRSSECVVGNNSTCETKEQDDPFGLYGSHNGYPPRSEQSTVVYQTPPTPISSLDKSAVASRIANTNGYVPKEEIVSQIAYISPQVSTASTMKPVAYDRKMSSKTGQALPMDSLASLSNTVKPDAALGYDSSNAHDKASMQNKYIQEFQDFVLKKESISQLESALRAPQQMASSAEPETSTRDSDQPHGATLPPPPPYTPHAFQGLNVPPISVICRQIQRDYPGLAGVPLALIEKSLLTLGFPVGNLGIQTPPTTLTQQTIPLQLQTIRPSLQQNLTATNFGTQLNTSNYQSIGTTTPLSHIHSTRISQPNVFTSVPTTSCQTDQAIIETTTASIGPVSKLSHNGMVHSSNPQSLLNPQAAHLFTSVANTHECTTSQQMHTVTNPVTPVPSHTPGLSMAAHLLAQQALQRSMALLQAQQMASIAHVQSQQPLTFGAVAETQNTPTTSSSLMLPAGIDSTLLSSLVRNALFPQINNAGGNAPSHVILPKSLFNMATQGLVPVVNPNGTPQLSAKALDATTPATPIAERQTPTSTPAPEARFDNEQHTNDCPTLTEYLKTHQSGLVNLGRRLATPGTSVAQNLDIMSDVSIQPREPTKNKLEIPPPQSLPTRPSFLPVSSATQYNHTLPTYQTAVGESILRSVEPPPLSFTRQPDTPNQMLEAAAMVTGNQAAHHQRNLLLAHAALMSGKNPEDIFNCNQTSTDTPISVKVAHGSESDAINVSASGRQSAPPLSPYQQCDMPPRIHALQHKQDAASAPTTPIYSPAQFQVPYFSHQNALSVSNVSTPIDVHRPTGLIRSNAYTSPSPEINMGLNERYHNNLSNAETFTTQIHQFAQNNFQHNIQLPTTPQSHIHNFTKPTMSRSLSYDAHPVPLTQSQLSVPTTSVHSFAHEDYSVQPSSADRRRESQLQERPATVFKSNQYNSRLSSQRSQNKHKKRKTAKVAACVAPTKSATMVQSNAPASSGHESSLPFNTDFTPRTTNSEHTIRTHPHTTSEIKPGRSLLTENVLHTHLIPSHLESNTMNRGAHSLHNPSTPLPCDTTGNMRKHELGGKLQQYLAEVAGLSTGTVFTKDVLPQISPLDGGGYASRASNPQASHIPAFVPPKSSNSGIQARTQRVQHDTPVENLCGATNVDGINGVPQRSEHEQPLDISWNKPHPVDESYCSGYDTRDVAKHAVVPSIHAQNPIYLPQTEREACPIGTNTVRPMDKSANLLMIKPPNAAITPPNMSNHPLYHDLKSPDSGIGESCLSPTESSGDTSSVQSGDRSAKRKRPFANRSNVRPIPTFSLPERPERRQSTSVQPLLKLDPSQCNYRCYMDTPISASQKLEDDRITYMNKGQFYNVIIEYKPKSRPLPTPNVKSVLMVLFRDDKSVTDEFRAWQFWHSRQHSVKQRILDIDLKSSGGFIPNSIEETSHNAISFKWNPMKHNAKISITINCLSTDFSNQKGVKGLPLHVQVDTFEEESNSIPVHRTYCQVKVFCDKGAERKARDEERKKEAKCKNPDQAVEPPAVVSHSKKNKLEQRFHPPCDISDFYDLADLKIQPILFSPVKGTEEASPPPKAIVFPTIDPKMAQVAAQVFTGSSTDEQESQPKRPRQAVEPSTRRQHEKVLLYVRESHEAVFTALLLLQPTLESLIKAVEEKYGIPISNIINVYKRSKKGILVKMDDNIVRHYSNESTLLITLTKYLSPSDGSTNYDVTLQDLD